MDALLQTMLDRAQKPAPIQDTLERTQFPQESPKIPQKESTAPAPVEPLNPYLTSLMGGLADTASTYAFLKRGTANEDNPLVAGLADSPGKMAGLGLGVNVALPLILKNTLGKKYPKIAEMIAANQGALQMGYGALNTQNTLNPRRDGFKPDPIKDRKTSSLYSSALTSQIRGAK